MPLAKILGAVARRDARLLAGQALPVTLVLLLAYPLIGRTLATPALAVDPNHEHLTLGGIPASIPLALHSHPHTLNGPHSHPITGSALDPVTDRYPQVLSYGGGLLAVGAVSLGDAAAAMLPPALLVPLLPQGLLFPLAIAAGVLGEHSGFPPPLPPPK